MDVTTILEIVVGAGLLAWMARMERVSTRQTVCFESIQHTLTDDGDARTMIAQLTRHSDKIKTLETKVDAHSELFEIVGLTRDYSPEDFLEMSRVFKAAASVVKRRREKNGEPANG